MSNTPDANADQRKQMNTQKKVDKKNALDAPVPVRNVRITRAPSHLLYKVALLGDQKAGKSSIFRRYTADAYTTNYVDTIGVEFEKKELKVAGNPVMLHIYDTMGGQDMKTLIKSYYRQAQGIILVFDFARKETLSHIKDWMYLVEMHCDPVPPIVLVGNKVDLDEKHHDVEVEEANAVAQRYGIELFKVSAKTGLNVTSAFERLAQMIFNNRKTLFPVGITSFRIPHNPQPPKKRNCCSET